MDAGSEGVSVYAEAKGEYTKQLCQYLVPALQQYFLDMLEDAKTKEPEPKKVLSKFQDLLEAVADWNMDKVQRETATLTIATRCDYLEELLTAVFIAHTKVLSAIRLTAKQKKLQITIPKLDHFLHRTLTECARLLWSNTFLVAPNAPSIERQKNLRQIETLLNEGVHTAIRGMLPVKNILREYLKGDDAEEEEEEEDEEEEKPVVSAPEPTVQIPEPAPAPEPVAAPPPPPPTPEEASAPLEFKGLTPKESAPTPAPTPEALAELVEEEPPVEEEEEEIKVVEGAPEEMDDFEDLEKPAAEPVAAPAPPPEPDFLPMDFEELS